MHLHPVPRLMQEFRTLTKILGDFVHTFDRRARRASSGTPGTVCLGCTLPCIVLLLSQADSLHILSA